jgi:hypothetical protein
LQFVRERQAREQTVELIDGELECLVPGLMETIKPG